MGSQLEIIKSLSGVQAKAMKPVDIETKLSDFIGKAFLDCGQQSDAMFIQVLTADMMGDIKKRHPGLTMDEVGIAFKNGVLEDYGPFFGINRKSLNQFLKGYSFSNERVSVKKMLAQPKAEKLSEEQIERKMYLSTLWAFRVFKRTNYVEDIGNVKYKYLRKKSAINFTEERRKEFKAQAKLKLEQEAMERLATLKDSAERLRISTHVKEVLKGDSPSLIAEAKRIALNTYFKDLVEKSIELKEQIEK